MAIEQLAELHASGRYDLIVVDTPPTRHALDFLDAPKRIHAFLGRRVIRWFVKPYFSAGWTTLRVVNRAAGNLLRRLEDATGVKALVEISDFFNSMSGLFEGFEQRVKSVDKLLRARGTAFVLVATPEEQILTEAEEFARKLAELSIRLRAMVFNRVHHEAVTNLRRLDEEWLRTLVGRAVKRPERAARLVDNFLRYETQARGDHLVDGDHGQGAERVDERGHLRAERAGHDAIGAACCRICSRRIVHRGAVPGGGGGRPQGRPPPLRPGRAARAGRARAPASTAACLNPSTRQAADSEPERYVSQRSQPSQ
jgi:anion-transporting  ArsA/GET3 family ATPase